MTDELRSTVGAVWLNHVRQGHGDPLILLHSLGGSLVQWSPVMDRLAAEREVIAVDMPGFGESPELPDGVSPRAANLATAVLDFYDALGIEGKPAVAGISLGGWVAIECARQGGASAAVGPLPGRVLEALARRREPDRCPPPAPRTARPPAASADHGDGTRAPPDARALHPSPRAPPPGRGRGDRQGLRDRARLRGGERADAGRPHRGAEGRSRSRSPSPGPSTTPWSGTGRCPTRLLPKRVEQVLLPGCGHVPTWDDPDLVARVVLAGARRTR